MKYIVLIVFLMFTKPIKCDKPCAARAIEGQSVVCVCNETYCDDITREVPARGRYITYTSSQGGHRFYKSGGQFLNHLKLEECCTTTLTLRPDRQFQTIEGFGGAATDAAGINWRNLSQTLQKYLVDSYFSKSGLEYNMMRVPIGGSDFSTHPYAYNELPENDTKLTNFSLAYEDYQYKIPLIKECMKAANTSIHIVASTWSPPVWMKSNHNFSGISRLKPEYYQTYADYHIKFIDKYAQEGIPVWGITTTNEPTDGLMNLSNFNSLGWSVKGMAQWIANNLGPTLHNSTFKDVKILAVDDQRITVFLWFDSVVKENPKTLDYIDGVAVHYYADFISPASILSNIPKNYPGKFVISTEACEGSYPWEKHKVELGSWRRAISYITDIISDLNHDVIGWIDWNMCLNATGGPNWSKNFVDSPIIVFPEKGEFVKQPMFYAMGHFSKFIPRGSRRIMVLEDKPLLTWSIQNVAFLTPNKTIVLVLFNDGYARSVAIQLGLKKTVLHMEAHSITTLELTY